ncbi:MAG TPA: hypothetical protein ENJ51_11220, partial [Leucothrix mucor]|nr:hypothetical protein [Leucothrix mucor]
MNVFDGCSQAHECFEIIDCDEDPMNISGTVINTCPTYDYGEITVSASGGGGGPYSYSWSNGSSSPSIDELPEGEYCVTATS